MDGLKSISTTQISSLVMLWVHKFHNDMFSSGDDSKLPNIVINDLKHVHLCPNLQCSINLRPVHHKSCISTCDSVFIGGYVNSLVSDRTQNWHTQQHPFIYHRVLHQRRTETASRKRSSHHLSFHLQTHPRTNRTLCTHCARTAVVHIRLNTHPIQPRRRSVELWVIVFGWMEWRVTCVMWLDR